MLKSCSLKSCWQRLLVQVGRRILKRLERTNPYNIYNHEKFIYVYVYITYYIYIYIYTCPFPGIPKLPATIHCCSYIGKEMTWIRIFTDFPGMSVETDFGEAPLSTTIPLRPGPKRQGSVQDSRWLPPLQFLRRSEVFGVHCTPESTKKIGSAVVFSEGGSCHSELVKSDWLQRTGTVSHYPLFVKMGNKGRIKTTTTVNCRSPLPWAAHVLRPCLAWKASGNIRALWWENPCVLEDLFWTKKVPGPCKDKRCYEVNHRFKHQLSVV